MEITIIDIFEAYFGAFLGCFTNLNPSLCLKQRKSYWDPKELSLSYSIENKGKLMVCNCALIELPLSVWVILFQSLFDYIHCKRLLCSKETIIMLFYCYSYYSMVVLLTVSCVVSYIDTCALVRILGVMHRWAYKYKS